MDPRSSSEDEPQHVGFRKLKAQCSNPIASPQKAKPLRLKFQALSLILLGEYRDDHSMTRGPTIGTSEFPTSNQEDPT